MKKQVLKTLLLILSCITVLVSIASCSPAATPPVATGTPSPAIATPSPEPSYPVLQPKPRFKIATTTSLYDTGLWAYLEPQFEKFEGVELDIVYAGTGAAINQGKAGNVDAVIVHDPDQEKTFVADGYGINKRSFAYNFFMIAGPAADPAGIKGLDPVAAFKKIAEGGAKDPASIKFISRGDGSGTHGAEKRLWADAGSIYAAIEKQSAWYAEAGQGMGPTLTMANERNAYVLCDGSTFTSYKGKLALVSLVDKPSASTLNVYNAYAIDPAKIKTTKIKVANDFINWLISPDTQKVIGEYGVKEFGGSLFHPIADPAYPAIPDVAENAKPIVQ